MLIFPPGLIPAQRGSRLVLVLWGEKNGLGVSGGGDGDAATAAAFWPEPQPPVGEQTRSRETGGTLLKWRILVRVS